MLDERRAELSAAAAADAGARTNGQDGLDGNGRVPGADEAEGTSQPARL